MPGLNGAFHGCSIRRKYNLLLYRVSAVFASGSDSKLQSKMRVQNNVLKRHRKIFRTTKLAPLLQKRIDANNVFACALP